MTQSAGLLTVDIDPLRARIIALNSLTNVDAPFTLYYDETNNIRRLLVTAEGFNVPDLNCFVLGGIGHDGPPRDLGFADLRARLRLQPSVRELKLAHLGKGGFLDLLGAPKIASFLEWLVKQGHFIHYQALDLLYWSTVDIIDSIAAESRHEAALIYGPQLKNTLYTVLRDDPQEIADLYRRYSYPDIGRDRRAAFLAELLELIECGEDKLDHVDHYMLKGVLQIGARTKSLPFLEDETPNILIDEFSAFFRERLILFPNASHILDIEETIAARLAKHSFISGGRTLDHYRFAASEDEPGIQISDVVAGLLGKAFTWLIKISDVDMWRAERALSGSQRDNLKILAEILDRSVGRCPAFAHYVLSLADQRRAAYFLRPRS